VLLKIDNRDVAQWRAEPGDHWHIKPNDPFIRASTNNPVGTRTEMTLRRGDETWKATVDLKEIAILASQTKPSRARPESQTSGKTEGLKP